MAQFAHYCQSTHDFVAICSGSETVPPRAAMVKACATAALDSCKSNSNTRDGDSVIGSLLQYVYNQLEREVERQGGDWEIPYLLGRLTDSGCRNDFCQHSKVRDDFADITLIT